MTTPIWIYLPLCFDDGIRFISILSMDHITVSRFNVMIIDQLIWMPILTGLIVLLLGL